jgi:glutamate racemase
VADADVLAEIRPAFVEAGGRSTDVVGLGCTHYPLLLERFERLSLGRSPGWTRPRPSPRRVLQLLGPPRPGHQADEGRGNGRVSPASAEPGPALRAALSARGLDRITAEFLPLTSA